MKLQKLLAIKYNLLRLEPILHYKLYSFIVINYFPHQSINAYEKKKKEKKIGESLVHKAIMW